MRVKYSKLMRKLYNIAHEIAVLSETYDGRYSKVYTKLSHALDVAEAEGLIVYLEDEDDDELFLSQINWGTKPKGA